MRSTFNNCLPHERTLHRWISSHDGSAGFTEQAFIFIKKKVDDLKAKTGEHLYVSVMFDEMAIAKVSYLCRIQGRIQVFTEGGGQELRLRYGMKNISIYIESKD